MKDRQTREHKETKAANAQPIRASESIAPANQAHLQLANADDGQETVTREPNNPKRNTQNLLMVTFTGLILVVTSAYSYFSWGQWTSMDKAIGETQRNRELEYRAYVGVKAVDIVQPFINAPVGNVTIRYANTGSVYGVIEYDDIFRQHHRTKFCYFNILGEGVFHPCAMHNSFD